MKTNSQYLGIFFGALYGLIIRLIGGFDRFSDFYSLYSLTFIWITPMVIGIFPILFVSNHLHLSKNKLFLFPVITVILFLLTALALQLEDFICILIMGFPFILVAGLVGLIVGGVVKRREINKRIYSLFLLPLLLNPIENLLPDHQSNFEVKSSVMIHQSASTIFPKLLEVPEISADKYEAGVYQMLGIPRPIKSELKTGDKGVYRIGTFTDGLQLYEEISDLKENEFVNFKIDLQKSQLRAKPTDQHILKGKNFKFNNINYHLTPIDQQSTRVTLTCDYTLNSKMNFYANYWAQGIIQDFEKRLLAAIKLKLEKQTF